MSSPSGSRRIFLVAGEVSGDIHGAALAGELRSLNRAARLEGIGGPRMAAAGVTLIEDSSGWGVIGWFEAARHVLPFMRRLDATVARLRADPPDVLVLIDFPGFNLTLLKRLGGAIRAVYYVPPMVTTRRGRRAERVAALGARLLAIFPFEAEAYRRAGADVIFVGHPAVDLRASMEPAARVRARLGLGPDAPVLGLLPGSRHQEITQLLPRMLTAARPIREALPAVALALALASPIFRGEVERTVAAFGLPVVIVEGARDVMAASEVVLMASGTATVEAMVMGVPMVVTYRASLPSWLFAHIALKGRFAAIPNILANEAVVPELLQWRATAEEMRVAALALLRDAAARTRMRQRLLALAETVGPPGAPHRAAGEVLAAMGMS